MKPDGVVEAIGTEPDRARRTFMLECYWPGVTSAALEEVSARAGDEASRSDLPVRLRGCWLAPGDEVAYIVFDALEPADAAAVTAVARSSGIAFERVVEVVEVRPAELEAHGGPAATH